MTITIRERALKDVQKVREENVNKYLLVKLRNLYELVSNISFLDEKITLNELDLENTFGLKKLNDSEDIIKYFVTLKHEFMIILKSPDYCNTNFETLKLIVCLNALCSDEKELKRILKVRKKDGKLYTFYKIIEIYNDYIRLLTESNSGKSEKENFTIVMNQLVTSFKASEK